MIIFNSYFDITRGYVMLVIIVIWSPHGPMMECQRFHQEPRPTSPSTLCRSPHVDLPEVPRLVEAGGFADSHLIPETGCKSLKPRIFNVPPKTYKGNLLIYSFYLGGISYLGEKLAPNLNWIVVADLKNL